MRSNTTVLYTGIMSDLPCLPLPREDLIELQQFCLENISRQQILEESLKRRGIPHEVISIDETRHVALLNPNSAKIDMQYYRVTLISHYDRVRGTPGANDNAACIFQLMNHWEKICKLGWQHCTQIIFTDKEELTKNMKPTDQGSWFLARHLKKLNVQNMLFLVLDMCGIGNTPVWRRNQSGIERIDNSISITYKMIEDFLKNYSNGQDFGVNPMFSDDLGLLLGGYPAIQLSVLPRNEALHLAKQYRQIKANSNNLRDNHQRIDLPQTWKTRHGPKDSVDSLDHKAFLLIARILRDLARYRFPLPQSGT